MAFTVTALRQLAPERFELTIDGEESFKTTLNTVADFSLYTGRVLTAEELSAVRSASELGRAKDRALRIIGARPHSSRELYDKLVEKGESEANAAACVAWLIDARLLDDADYAAMLVRHYAARGYGKKRVQNELYRRKVPKELWDEALEAMPEADETIDRLLRSRLRSAQPDRAELKKATDALLRRGYGWEEIRAAVSRFNSSIEEDY